MREGMPGPSDAIGPWDEDSSGWGWSGWSGWPMMSRNES